VVPLPPPTELLEELLGADELLLGQLPILILPHSALGLRVIDWLPHDILPKVINLASPEDPIELLPPGLFHPDTALPSM
jgi:hypothetical protein